MLVFGTRPEAIKMCPLVIALKNKSDIKVTVCVTGQHQTMLESVLGVFNIVPDYNLSIMQPKQTLFDITTRILDRIKVVLEQERPDIVLVHGDTTTSFTAALACFYLGIKIGHVEAGLRSFNIMSPYPEEFNRKAISLVSAVDFAPTDSAAKNLINEGKDKSKIFVTGNTGIDSLRFTINNNYRHKELDWVGNSRLILITAHRRENIGLPMANMFKAIRDVLEIHKDVKAIYPVHMNPAVRDIANKFFANTDNVHLIQPLDVIDFHNFLSRSYLVLTDSGGIQEEAPSLGKPVLVLRTTTERPEGVQAGTLKLVGTEYENIFNEFNKLLSDDLEYKNMSMKKNPYGDGFASNHIADILESIL